MKDIKDKKKEMAKRMEPHGYAKGVRRLEGLGMSRGDAQGAADAAYRIAQMKKQGSKKPHIEWERGSNNTSDFRKSLDKAKLAHRKAGPFKNAAEAINSPTWLAMHNVINNDRREKRKNAS